METLREKFAKWLETEGYSKITPSGNPSTIADYTARVHRIAEHNWARLAENALTYIHSDNLSPRDRVALIKFNEFLYLTEYPRDILADVFHYSCVMGIKQIWVETDDGQKIEAEKVLLTRERAADALGITPRTLDRLIKRGDIDYYQATPHGRVQLSWADIYNYRESIHHKSNRK